MNLKANVFLENVSNKKVNWKSNNDLVAKILANGQVKGMAAGYAAISAIADDNDKVVSECVIIIKPKKVKIASIGCSKSYSNKSKYYVNVRTRINGSYKGIQIRYAKKRIRKAQKY